ncbi:MAG: PrsW family glutamic-type intramembrane protease, partial [Verrucomicrobiota bacterium]
DFVQGLVNNIAGIGLREEFIKLVCFLPLIPFLLKRANPIEALVVAGFVGLGFAIQENLSYYSRSGGNATVSRFLSANFFHLAMTGLAGYAAYRFAQLPRRRWEEFLATFLTVVLAHGIYDALLTLPEFIEHSWLAIIVFALLAYRFFGVAHGLPFTWRQELSPLGIFVVGTSLLVGVTLNVVCYGEVPYPSYVLFLLSCIQLVPMAFIFVNTFRSS